MVLDTADAEIGYADDRATFDVNASSGDRRVHVAGTRRSVDAAASGASRSPRPACRSASRRGCSTPRASRRSTVLPNEVRVERHPLRRRHRPDCRGRPARWRCARRPSRACNVSVRGLDLLPIEELAGQEDPEFAGLLNGVARITGPAGQPEVLGSFAIASGRFRELQFARVAGAVHYDEGRIGVDVVVEQAPGVTLAVNGSVPLALFTSSDATAAEAGLAGGGAAPDRSQHRELGDRPADRHRPDAGDGAGDRHRDGEAARHRHRRQPAVRRRRGAGRRRRSPCRRPAGAIAT